jgi:virginiamycin B lyase
MKHPAILIAVLCVPLLMPAQPAPAAEVEYFPVTAGDHPHDVAPAPDGTVWYTDSGLNAILRVDQASKEVTDRLVVIRD